MSIQETPQEIIIKNLKEQVENIEQFELLNLLLEPSKIVELEEDELQNLFQLIALDADINTDKELINEYSEIFSSNELRVYSKDEISKRIEDILSKREQRVTIQEIINLKAKKSFLRVERIKQDINEFKIYCEENNINYMETEPKIIELLTVAEKLRDDYLKVGQEELFNINAKNLFENISKIVLEELNVEKSDCNKFAQSLINWFQSSAILKFTDEQKKFLKEELFNIHDKLLKHKEEPGKLKNIIFKTIDKIIVLFEKLAEKFFNIKLGLFDKIHQKDENLTKLIKQLKTIAKISVIDPEELKNLGSTLKKVDISSSKNNLPLTNNRNQGKSII